MQINPNMVFRKLSFLALAACILTACQPTRPEASLGAATTVKPVLQDTAGWKIDTLSTGFIRYNYTRYYEPYTSAQIVNVLEVDLASGRYDLVLDNVFPEDSLSSVAEAHQPALAAVNGTYYELVENGQSSSFFKADNEIKTSVTLPTEHKLFWKHEGAFYYDGAKKQMGIAYGDNASYTQMPYANIISGSPMLIYEYKPVGETFAKSEDKPLEQLDYEHPDRHQGVRHPRTAIATVGKNRVLLITVDGRHAGQSAGMSAKELTQFIQKYFNPAYALNLDGGGSTTMWIRGEGVINYPTDNKRFDHYGQRRIRNYIMVTEKSANAASETEK
ncbi:phosphodiester glycosidase family protein [Pontibacter sp. BT731]|uniref:phosphodiester glycosidase family protein n=1 Tax=Pontibacter coccineus TaxID=3063328 RepID=UPI0026E16F8F|nr:phosphodiester glycosidase family protein [Pontibacter sp. BT731]MDO6390104.1 phosphodiester glycosidase family protein [Pontibacter sp. BT731]